MRKAAIVTIAISYFVLFCSIFASPNGVLGDLTFWSSMPLKTKIINSLAIFGFEIIGVSLWLSLSKTPDKSNIPSIFIVCLLIAFQFGFISVDCAIYNFCSPQVSSTGNCVTTYDKQGAYQDCE
jgi:hypothetical protein